VLPLDDRRSARFDPAIAGRRDMMAGRTSLTVYPGMVGMMEKALDSVKGVRHTVTAEVELKDARGRGHGRRDARFQRLQAGRQRLHRPDRESDGRAAVRSQGGVMNERRSLITGGLLVVLLWLGTPTPAGAQPVAVPETWGGDVWSRPRLTGSWGGFRDELGKKGIVFDADLLLTPQGVLEGGRDTGVEFWGTAEYTLNVDTGKAGLWPGGFLKVYAGSTFGDSISRDSGALVPVNTAFLVPEFDEPSTGLMHATFMQFLSPKFGLLAGKIYTLDANHGEFTGNYRTQFMNAGLTLPMSLALVPLSAYGGGLVVLPWEGVVLSALLLDPSGTVSNNDITEAFDDGFMVLGVGQAAITPFGLRGTQKAGFMWSDKTRLSLEQDPGNLARLLATEQFPLLGNPGPILRRLLERFFPQLLIPTQRANREDSTWTLFYAFDQYLWHPGGDTTRGIGVFFNFGVSDGQTNPVKYSYSMGIGGKGVVPGRPHDTFGVGWARTEFSDDFLPFLRQRLRLGLDREDAVEIFYNASVTSWLNATLNLQVIEPALSKTLGSSGQLKDVDTTVVAGLRLYVRF
jgi:porin